MDSRAMVAAVVTFITRIQFNRQGWESRSVDSDESCSKGSGSGDPDILVGTKKISYSAIKD